MCLRSDHRAAGWLPSSAPQPALTCCNALAPFIAVLPPMFTHSTGIRAEENRWLFASRARNVFLDSNINAICIGPYTHSTHHAPHNSFFIRMNFKCEIYLNWCFIPRRAAFIVDSNYTDSISATIEHRFIAASSRSFSTAVAFRLSTNQWSTPFDLNWWHKWTFFAF